ncbi:10513_t:CDS:2 [Paraglomus occultum]|uniref:10513_t:CDS:1 n=1 Tax=Paraglomus occultum TaxID=144539 RepID=A0A9N8WA99_9GLOM|nr:10513_t:CDS:2 [Paraglomus occultum]
MSSINQPTITPPQPPAPPKRTKHGLTYQNACVNVALNERQYLFLFDVAVRAYGTVAVLKLLQPWFVRPDIPKNLLLHIKSFFTSFHALLTIITYIISSFVITKCFHQIIGKKHTRSWIILPGDENFWCPSYRKDKCLNDPSVLNEYRAIAGFYSIIFGFIFALKYTINYENEIHFYKIRTYSSTIHFLYSNYQSLLSPSTWRRYGSPLIARPLLYLESKHPIDYKRYTFLFLFTLAYWTWHLIFWKTWYHGIIRWTPWSKVEYEWMKAPLFDIETFNRTLFSAFACLALWDTLDKLFSFYFTNVIFASAPYMDPNSVLVDGLRATEKPYTQHLAFLELHYIARIATPQTIARRTSIFKDRDSWDTVSRSCMSFLFSFALCSQAHLILQKPDEKKKPDRHEELMKMILPPHYASERKKFGRGKRLFYDLVFLLLNESVDRKTRRLCRDKELVVFGVEALASLTAASLTLDQYGVVQSDIPKVFECLIDVLISLEKYSNKPPVGLWDGRSPSEVQLRALNDIVGLTLVVKDAINELTMALHEYLDTVRLPPPHHNRLEKLLNEHM